MADDGAPKAKRRSEIELGELTVHNVKLLKMINEIVLPVPYSDKFYKDAVASGEFAKLAFHDDIVVGGVCCRVEPVPGAEGEKQLYIMTLGCLAPYRRRGLGSLMLDHVLALAAKDPTVTCVCLHVQTANEDAISFYQRHGFSTGEPVKGYYKRATDMDAYLLKKPVGIYAPNNSA